MRRPAKRSTLAPVTAYNKKNGQVPDLPFIRLSCAAKASLTQQKVLGSRRYRFELATANQRGRPRPLPARSPSLTLTQISSVRLLRATVNLARFTSAHCQLPTANRQRSTANGQRTTDN